jgi:Dynamin GTPase effector domain
MKSAADTTIGQIKLQCELECNRPFTLNNSAYLESKNIYIYEMVYERSQDPTSPVPVSSTTHYIKDPFGNSHSIASKGKSDDVLRGLLTAEGYHITSTKQLARLKDSDEYEAEVTAMAQVLAYFDISSKRIVDIMAMIFETVFARGFGNSLRKSLITDLKLIGDHGVANCKRFAKDEPEVDSKRAYLERQIEILSKGHGIVSRFFN